MASQLSQNQSVCLLDMWEILRDPEIVEKERMEMRQQRPLAQMFNHAMELGQQMLGAFETGEYVGCENREIVAEEAKANMHALHQSAYEQRRSAESARRTAEMIDDVESMERRQAMEDSDEYQ